MDCERHTETLIDSARSHADLPAALKAHVRACEPCAERWDSERDLSAYLKLVSGGASELRSSAASRESLMREFDARKVKVMTPRWYWGIAAAAALLFGIALGPEAVNRLQHTRTNQIVADDSAIPETEGTPDGFIAVPYAPPLADGEMMRIVHTELNPAALASLGVSVDPAWTTQLPADLLLGEDGMPRAVRVADVETEEGGF